MAGGGSAKPVRAPARARPGCSRRRDRKSPFPAWGRRASEPSASLVLLRRRGKHCPDRARVQGRDTSPGAGGGSGEPSTQASPRPRPNQGAEGLPSPSTRRPPPRGNRSPGLGGWRGTRKEGHVHGGGGGQRSKGMPKRRAGGERGTRRRRAEGIQRRRDTGAEGAQSTGRGGPQPQLQLPSSAKDSGSPRLDEMKGIEGHMETPPPNPAPAAWTGSAVHTSCRGGQANRTQGSYPVTHRKKLSPKLRTQQRYLLKIQVRSRIQNI